jgi:hypothetical protein
MTEIGIDLEAEIAQVRGELVSFRDVCLPAFFGRCGLPDRASPAPGPIGLTKAEWARLSDRLLEALPHGGRAGRLDLDDYSFLHVITEPSYAVDGGRIVWRCETFFPIFSDDHLENISSHVGGGPYPGDLRKALIARLPEWFLGRAVDGTTLWNALCSALPLLVDPNPDFVRRALDQTTWRSIVLGKPGLTLRDRAKKFSLLDGYYFSHVLNNSLLHVLGAAANNRFDLLLELLDHPNLSGMYLHLMPHYILGVLLAKVRALRSLAGVEEESQGGGSRPDLGDVQGEAEVGEPTP